MCCCNDNRLGMPIIEDTPEMIEHLRRFRLGQAIENRFTFRPPSTNQVLKDDRIRDAAKSLAILIADLCPESRELDQALIKVDEVVMWASASIVRNQE